MTQINSYYTLVQALNFARTDLLAHPIYKSINNLDSLQIFMENHCFAVWDFMTLLKSLQRDLTCVSIPWVPPKNTFAARLVNEIVLAEESDEVSPGHYRGHFDLYVEAMGELDANGCPVLELVDLLSKGMNVNLALEQIPILDSTKEFVNHTLKQSKLKTHEVAAAFLFGREDIIPEMFQNLLDEVQEIKSLPLKSFKNYLNRHIALDHETHGPMGVNLLQYLCDSDPKKWSEAFDAALAAIDSRIKLWDGIMEFISLKNLESSSSIQRGSNEVSR